MSEITPTDPTTHAVTGPVADVLNRRCPKRIPYSPNYWQWFEHEKNRRTIPEISHCETQLDLLRYLGADVFSRNIYSNQQTGWIGGLCDVVWTDVIHEERETRSGADRVFERIYKTKKGTLTERQRYVWDQSTVVQEKYLVDDPANQMDAFEELVRGRRWRFSPERYRRIQMQAGEQGCVIAGELYSPLKLFHFALNPAETCFFVADEPERAEVIMAQHEAAMLDLARQIAAAGVPAMMSMDNLDTLFHPPRFVEKYSASFYEKASRICHEHDSRFFIHACGKQKDNLALIASLGVDGLEGVAFPSLGDVELDEAMRLSGERLIITGGVSAMECERLTTREEVFGYVSGLLARMKPYAHRFVMASSCTTPYNARWETMKHFRDAWLEHGAL